MLLNFFSFCRIFFRLVYFPKQILVFNQRKLVDLLRSGLIEVVGEEVVMVREVMVVAKRVVVMAEGVVVMARVMVIVEDRIT